MPDISINQKTQVIIVGAGPTGLSMALQLLRFGIDFVIIERNEKTTPYSKALVVQARTLEIFKEIGISEKAISEGRITTAMNIFYGGKQKAAINIAGLGEGLSAFPFALSLEQSKTEKLLADHLSEKGKEIQWKSTFTRFEQNNNGVVVYYENANRQEQIIEAEYLVGCDGASSLIRHQLGLTFQGDTVPKIFYVTDVTISSPVINKDELFIFLIKKGFVLFFPMEGNAHYRIVGILPNKAEEDENFKFDDIETNLKEQMAIPLTFEEIRWFSTYKVHSRKANAFMRERCFIAGDAAHIHTPAGGQGMNTGIQDAYNLAWKLAYTIKYKVDISILESYNTERMGNATHLLKTTDRMFDILAGSGWFLNFIRPNLLPQLFSFVSRSALLKKRIFPLISEIGIAYPDSALTCKSKAGKIRAGDRMPYFVFSDGKDIFEYLKEPLYKILFFGTRENNHFEQMKSLKFPIGTFSFSEIPKAIFKSSHNLYILLRPDNHISYIGKDLNKCIVQLKKI
jgi:2-polyprenyl-6-methoxyphenol hydroxylase-like FAD-dependent oxidoreductase